MKKYQLNHPELLFLGQEPFVFDETEKGYKTKIGEKEWLGFPKSIVENSQAFELIPEKKKRPRIKSQKSVI